MQYVLQFLALLPAVGPSTGPVVVDRGRIGLVDQVVVAGERTGVLADAVPEAGTRVTHGTTVARFRDESIRAALVTAEERLRDDVAVRYAEAERDVAVAEYEKALLANRRLPGTVPDIEVRRLELSAASARLQVEKAERDRVVLGLERDELLADLATYRVVAPFDGVVSKVYRRRGEAVRQGDPILEIVGTDRLRVDAQLTVDDARRIRIGDVVEVALEGDSTLHGHVEFIDVQVQPVTRTVRVRAIVDNPDGLLGAGLVAPMTIRVDQRS